MGKTGNWPWDAGSESWPAGSSAAHRKVRTRLYHPRGTRVRDLVQLLALVFVSSSLSTGFSIKVGCWWPPDVAFGLLCRYALCLRTDVLTQTSVSCSFCCSWAQLFLSLSPWALPAVLSRSVGHGGVLSSLTACCLSAVGSPRWTTASLTSEGSWPHKTHCFPGAAAFFGFSSACSSVLS